MKDFDARYRQQRFQGNGMIASVWEAMPLWGNLVTIAAAAAAGYGIVQHVAAVAEQDHTHVMRSLDQVKTEIFSSLHDCIGKGYNPKNCTLTQQRALNLASDRGAALSYETTNACLKAHRIEVGCQTKQLAEPTTHRVVSGDASFIRFDGVLPPVVGWQAAISSLQAPLNPNGAKFDEKRILAAPLYPYGKDLIRKDKKVFTLQS